MPMNSDLACIHIQLCKDSLLEQLFTSSRTRFALLTSVVSSGALNGTVFYNAVKSPFTQKSEDNF